MHLVTLGLNHTTAPVQLRERVVVAPELLADTLASITSRWERRIPHAIVLSTCNRTEIYAAVDTTRDDLAALEDALTRWMAERHAVPHDLLRSHWYWHVDAASVRHACRVACGLDSMVLGEPQILGQMKEAVRASEAVGVLGTPLRQALDRAFAVAKSVRSSTAIGEASISMSAAAVRLAQRIFDRLADQHLLLIGAGEMVELAASHFVGQRPRSIAVANRTLARGERLAAKLASTGIPTRAMLLSELPTELARFDVVLSSTASTLPLVGLGMVERAVKARRRKPMFMVDLGVPRDIEVEVAKLDDVYLYSVDDLGQIVARGRQSRLDSVEDAETIIEREVAQFMRWLDSRDAVPVIRELHRRGDEFRTFELDRARRRLAKGDDPEVVLEALAAGITGKFLHGPTQLLNDAPDELRTHLLEYLPRLFGSGPKP